MSRSGAYPRKLRERAVRMVVEIRPQYESEYAAITAVAGKLGITTAETVHKWVRRAHIDGGQGPGVSSDEAAEIKRLRRENAELRRANETLGRYQTRGGSLWLLDVVDASSPPERTARVWPTPGAGWGSRCSRWPGDF